MGGEPFVVEDAHRACVPHVLGEAADEPGNRLRHRITGPVEHVLGRSEDAADVACAPGVGQVPRRGLRARSDERLDIRRADRVAAGPGDELLDLARELVEVVADELGEQAAGFRLDGGSAQLELLGHPAWHRSRQHIPEENRSMAGDGFRERRVFAQIAGDERKRRAGRGRLEVRRDRLDIGRLPELDAFEDDQPAPEAEEAHGVAGGNCVVPAHRRRVVQFDRVGFEASTQARNCAIDLGPVAAADQVGRLEAHPPSPPSIGRERGARRRPPQLPDRPVAWANGGGSDAARTGSDVRSHPPVQRREQCRERPVRRGRRRPSRAPSASSTADDRLDQRVGDHPEERHLAELQPENRRRRNAARPRDGRQPQPVSPAPGSPRGRGAAARQRRRSRARPRRTAGIRDRRACTGSTRARWARASSRVCHGSRSRAASHATETAPPETAARITDGCGPTAST